MTARRSQIGPLVVAVMVVMSACSGAEALLEGSDQLVSGTVTDSGFVVSLADLAFSGPAGVAPVGTVVIIKRTDDVGVADTGVVPAAQAFDISFSDGSQPEQPVTVTLKLDGKHAATEPLGFATEDSRTGQWTGLPVSRTDHTASVTMTHFSWGFFGWLGDVKASFDDAVNKFLKLRYDPPDCMDTPLDTAAGEMSVTASGNGIYVCAEEVTGEPTLTVRSNSPFVWRLAGPDEQVTPVYPTSPIDLTQILTTAVYRQVAQDRAGYETILVPGGTAGLSVTGTLEPLEASADVDAALGLIGVIVYGIDQAMAMAGVPLSLDDAQKTREIAECIAGIIELGDQPDVGISTRTILGCFGSAVGGVAGVVVGLLTSASSLLVNFVVGAIGEITQTNHLSIDVAFTNANTEGPGSGTACGALDLGLNTAGMSDSPTVEGARRVYDAAVGCDADALVRLAEEDNTNLGSIRPEEAFAIPNPKDRYRILTTLMSLDPYIHMDSLSWPNRDESTGRPDYAELERAAVITSEQHEAMESAGNYTGWTVTILYDGTFYFFGEGE